MWIEAGQFTRRRFCALAALLAVSLVGCRRDSRAESRGGASSRAKQTEPRKQTDTRKQVNTRRQTETRRPNQRSQAADAPVRRQVESP